MTRQRTDNFRFTAPVVNGEISDPTLYRAYKNLVEDIRVQNILNFKSPLKEVVRKRYRGPRKSVGKTWNSQSMCLKRHAMGVDVYVLTEPRKERNWAISTL